MPLDRASRLPWPSVILRTLIILAIGFGCLVAGGVVYLLDVDMAASLLAQAIPGKGHFDNGELAFDYSRGWLTFAEYWPSAFKSAYTPNTDRDLDAEEVAGVLEPGFAASVRIEVRPLPPEKTLREVYRQTYASGPIRVYATQNAISERTLIVDGVTAFERIYRKPHGEPWYQIRDVWLVKGSQVYIISCWAPPEKFAAHQADFDLVVNSFHVK